MFYKVHRWHIYYIHIVYKNYTYCTRMDDGWWQYSFIFNRRNTEGKRCWFSMYIKGDVIFFIDQ